MRRKGNSIALLVEMETDTAAVENNMKIPLKTTKKKKKLE